MTLCRATCRDSPATNPVSPARAPLLIPSVAIGDFTLPLVMFTIRPNFRAIIPSNVALISAIGVSMFASSALIQSSRVQSRKSPAGGPPALFTRMSGSGHAASTAAWFSAVVMSPATAVTRTPVAARISAAVASSVAAVRAVITRSTPSRASPIAQARPSPLLAAQTIARLPFNPVSIIGPSGFGVKAATAPASAPAAACARRRTHAP